jgi:hypothetical protein
MKQKENSVFCSKHPKVETTETTTYASSIWMSSFVQIQRHNLWNMTTQWAVEIKFSSGLYVE